MKPSAHVVACGLLLVCGCSSRRAPHDDRTETTAHDEMAMVPAGWFSIGCYRLFGADDETRGNDRAADDTQRLWNCVQGDPPRRVWLSSFEIDRFEVTNNDYERCLKAGACGEASRSGRGTGRHGALPAVVTFENAARYCTWRRKRLPSDAEWQKAARGTDDRIYPWGDERPACEHVHVATVLRDGFEASNLCSDRSHFLVDAEPVGMHPAGASPYGVNDLLGTVDEWVSDWFAPKELAGDPPPPGFSYADRQSSRGAILEYDWSGLKFPWTDPSVVNPHGPSRPDNPPQLHATKPGVYGIPGVGLGKPDPEHQGTYYAGFRCARSVAGPNPPQVPRLAPGTSTLPYREPGYAPGAIQPPVAPGTQPQHAL